MASLIFLLAFIDGPILGFQRFWYTNILDAIVCSLRIYIQHRSLNPFLKPSLVYATRTIEQIKGNAGLPVKKKRSRSVTDALGLVSLPA